MPYIELTEAISKMRVLIDVDSIGEVRDLSGVPNRHLEKYGRTEIKHKVRSRSWKVCESYDVVIGRICRAQLGPGHALVTRDDQQTRGAGTDRVRAGVPQVAGDREGLERGSEGESTQ